MIFERISLQEISNDFIKNNFELMISINLFTKKKVNLFSSSNLIQFHLYSFYLKRYLHSLYENNLLQNFNFITKIIFTCFYKKFTILFTKVFQFVFI